MSAWRLELGERRSRPTVYRRLLADPDDAGERLLALKELGAYGRALIAFTQRLDLSVETSEYLLERIL